MKKKMEMKMFRYGMTIVLILAFFFQCLIPIHAVEENGENTENFKEKEMAAENQDCIVIRTEEDLRQVAENCALDSWSVGKTFVLQNNISIENSEFLPIASFGGTWEGNGCIISGVNITHSLSPAGVFATIQEEGVVKDLKIIGRVAPSGKADAIGGVAGINYGSILNCSFEGYVKGENNIGGIVGINESGGEIRNCSFNGDVLGNHSTGGISGWNQGTIFACKNEGDVNIDGEDIEHKMSELSLSSLVNLNSTQNVTTHTDTGGIAGFSEGKIYYCINQGTIGYPHVGYNIGGITGRCKQSYIQNCTNNGKVLGRKDVGGITGQIEPLLEVEYIKDKFQILDEELDTFLNLMEQASSDMNQMSSQAFQYLNDISYYINTAGTAAGGLSEDSQEYHNSLNQGIDGMSQGILDLQKDLNEIEWDKNTAESEPSVSGNSIIQNLPSISGNEIFTNSYENGLNASKDALDDFLGTTGEQASAINDSSKEYSENMKYHMSAINANLEEAGKKMDALSRILIDGGENVSEDMSAVMEQAKVLRRIISELRDDMFEYEEAELQDVSEEKASNGEMQIGAGTIDNMTSQTVYDTTSFQKGKLTKCLNQGMVEADINVGGIAGVMATEYDTDPEDDIEIIGDTSLKTSKRVSVIIRDSRNEGKISAKKDCVGGIVGKAEVGAVVSCESYGNVESMNGNYIGGIAGKTAGTVKACYAKCTLAGDSYIGGIIGNGSAETESKESSVSNCYSMVEIKEGKQFLGAIAGKEDGSFYENYFVSDSLQGINKVNYHLKAEPVEYETMYQKENMVKGFQKLMIKFMLEEELLTVKEVQYGQSLSSHAYPQIPKKEGCYVVWDITDLQNLKKDTVVTACYIPYVMSVSAKECREDERPVFFAEGEFKEEDVLTITDKTEETKQKGIKNNKNTIKEEKVLEHWVLNIPDNTEKEEFTIHYLKPDGYKKVKLYVYEDKQWKKVSYEEEGSYYLFNVKDSRSEIIVTK